MKIEINKGAMVGDSTCDNDKTPTLKMTLKDINDISYVIIREYALKQIKLYDKLLGAIFPNYKIDNNQYKGRYCIGVIMNRENVTSFVYNNEDLFVFYMMRKYPNVNEKTARAMFKYNLIDFIMESQRIVHQARISVIEKDIINGTRKWQYNMSRKIKNAIHCIA